MSEESCVDALRHGAVDYLLKDRLSRLGSAVQHALSQRRLVADQRRAEETFRAAFDHAPVGMAVTDLDGHVLEVNQELARMTGLQPAQLLLDMVLEEDRPIVADKMKRLVAGEAEKVSKELRLCRSDGAPLWGQYSASLIGAGGSGPGGDQGAHHVVHQIADVTDRRRAEEALQRQAAKLARTNSDLQELDRLKSEFVATVSHELRTPLTSIRGYTEILADAHASSLGATERKIVGIIDRNGRRLLDLIEDLLTFSRIESGTLTLTVGPVKVKHVIDAACEAIRPSVESAGLTITTDIDEHIPVVQGDGDQLERVVLNLLTNAVKFSDPGGSITVTGRERDGQVVVCDAGHRGRHPGARAGHAVHPLLPHRRRSAAGDQGQRPGPGDQQGDRGGTRWLDRPGVDRGQRHHRRLRRPHAVASAGAEAGTAHDQPDR